MKIETMIMDALSDLSGQTVTMDETTPDFRDFLIQDHLEDDKDSADDTMIAETAVFVPPMEPLTVQMRAMLDLPAGILVKTPMDETETGERPLVDNERAMDGIRTSGPSFATDNPLPVASPRMITSDSEALLSDVMPVTPDSLAKEALPVLDKAANVTHETVASPTVEVNNATSPVMTAAWQPLVPDTSHPAVTESAAAIPAPVSQNNPIEAPVSAPVLEAVSGLVNETQAVFRAVTVEPAVDKTPVRIDEEPSEPVAVMPVRHEARLVENNLPPMVIRAFQSLPQRDTALAPDDDANLVSVREVQAQSSAHKPAVDSLVNAPAAEPAHKTSDAMFSNLASFLNKTTQDTEAAPARPALVSDVNTDYINGDKQNTLRSFQYQPGSLAGSLKVDAFTAKIKVYPPDLGQINAEIIVNKGVADLRLTTDNQSLRQFIETHLQPLRDSFHDVNLPLGQVQVNSEASREESGFARQRNDSRDELPYRPQDEAMPKRVSSPAKTSSIIDTYA